MFLDLVTFIQQSHSLLETFHWTHGSFPTKQDFGSLRAQLKKTPSTNAGSVKRSDKRSKASASNKHMNYSNCQELWLHDITSSSLLLIKSKPGYPMCRWAVPHSLLCSSICVLMDAHWLSQRKSFHLTETCKLCKQLLLGFAVVNEMNDSRLLLSFCMLRNEISSNFFPTIENIMDADH